MKNSACPNTSSREWKELVKALGSEADAHTAYELNGGDIPTIEKAEILLKKLTVKERDEQISLSSDQFKLERSISQRKVLEQVKIKTTNTKQRETIDKLVAMNNAYQEFLRENINKAKNGIDAEQTLSATKFIGASEFSGDPKEYESFKLFGTFMHELLEIAQFESINSKKTIAEIYNRKFFDKVYQDFLKKNPFNILKLDAEEMYAMGDGIVQKINTYNFNGSIILPEITVMGTAASGSKVIGRLDLLLIDPLGKIQILDFKTKKVKNMVQKDLAGNNYVNKEYALTRLADAPRFEITQRPGTAEALASLPLRTTYDTWALQLNLYDRILQQSGMEVSKKSVITLLYDIDTETKEYLGQALHFFDTQDYYEQTINLIEDKYKSQAWFSDSEYINEWVKSFEDALAKEMPIPGEIEKKERLARSPEEAFPFVPSEQNMQRFIDELSSIVEGQMKKLNDDINKTTDKNLKKLLTTRKDNLRSFQKIIDDSKSKSKRQGLKNASNFFHALEIVESEITSNNLKGEDIIEKFRKTLNNSGGKDVMSKLLPELKQITEIFSQTQILANILGVMNEIVADARSNPENNINADNPIFKKLGDINNYVANIESLFREMQLRNGIEIFKSPGEKVFEAVTKDMENALKPRLLYLQKKLEDLKSNGEGFLTSTLNSFYSFLDKTYKEKFKKSVGPDGVKRLNEIEKVEKEILKIQGALSGYKYDDETIEKYITGVTNPKSIIYLGSQNIWNSDTLLKGRKFDEFIASASNSDLGISAFTTMLKQQEAQARHNMINDINMSKFEKNLHNMLGKGWSLENLNDAISGWREVSYYDKATKSIKTKKVLSITKPFSEDYEKTYREFNSKMKIFNSEVYQLKSVYNDKFGNAPQAEVDQAKNEYLKKVEERAAYNEQYIKWLLDNANLPYTEAFYELQLGLPEEIRTELQNIYLEREILLRDVGRGDEILLSEEDFDRLAELDVEQRKLFEKARDENEEYGKRLEMFNSLFEYDVNQKYYDSMEESAKIKYADDPEAFERWKKENTVSRPTAEWYEELSSLYDQRAQFYTEDFEMSELYEQKRNIMRPHKVGGRFNPKYLSDDEIKALDEVEAKIEDRMAELKKDGSTLSKADRKTLAIINDQIRQLRSNQPNENYVSEFNSKYRILQNAYKEMNSAMAALTVAKTENDKAKIESSENDLIKATSNFQEKEQRFKEWYNKNHVDNYVSIRKSPDLKAKKNPKSFNYEFLPALPVRKRYMEEVPNPKYYKIKRPKLGNWTLDGVELRNADIEKLKEDPEQIEFLKAEGRLITNPGAYNENFLKSPDGIPLPKEITINPDGEYVIDPKATVVKNVDPKYLKILNNPELKELYNSFTKMFFSLQEKTEGRKIGYNAPGIASSFVENIARDGFIKGFKKQKDIFLDKHIKLGESQQDRVENVFGELGKPLRMKFTDQLGEGLQSEDVIGSVMQWSTEAHMNIAMQEAAPKSKAFVEYLKLLRSDIDKDNKKGQTFITNEKGERVPVDMDSRLRELDEVIKQMEYENDKFLTGQLETNVNRKLKRITNALFGWTAFARIGFDIANQTKNYISGNLQAFLAAGANDSDHYSKEDFLVAKKLIYGYGGFMHNYFSDWGKVSDLHESTMLYRILNPLQKDMISYYQDVSGGKKRKAMETLASPGELGFLLQDKGDTEIGVTVMYAVLNSYRFEEIERIDPNTGEKIFKKDSNGNIVYVPAHKAYVKNTNGQLVIRSDVNYDKQDEKRLRNIIYSEIRRAQGNYAKSDQTRVERTVQGKAMMFFRKFLIPGMLNRFGYLRPNWEGSEMSMGYWRAVLSAIRYFGPGATLKEFFIGGKMLEKMGMTGLDTFTIKGDDGSIIKEDVGDFYKRKVHHARRDAIAMMVMTILGYLALSFVRQKDDDDEEIGVLAGNAVRVIWGTKMETMSMFPLGSGSTEYVKNFTTAIPFVREATSLIKATNHAWSLGLALLINGGEEPDPGYDSEFYEEIWKDAYYSRKSGPYEKGDAKLVKDFTDLTGIKNFRDIFSPSNRIEQLKKLQ